MSDRIKGFTVVLDKDYKDEDAETIANAIGMIKGVCSVVPSIADSNDHMNRSRIKAELQQKIMDILYE